MNETRSLIRVRTFIVIDTETTPDVDGSNHVVSLAARKIVDGEPAEYSSWLVNPQTPITTAWVHGITDMDVVDAPMFPQIVEQFAEFLDGDNVVVVGHSVGYDLAVLRGEYRRNNLGTPPSFAYIDTMQVAYLLGVSDRTSIRLKLLAERLNVAGADRPHNALSDVDATVRVFLALVEKAVANGNLDMDSWIVEGHNPKPSDPSPGLVVLGTLTGKHRELHSRPASDARLPVDDILLCVRERCELVADRVELLATPSTARRLLKAFANKPPKLREQGEAGTLAGVLQRLIPVAYKTGLDAEHWYGGLAPTLNAYPRCADTVATRCPDCRNSQPCPLDVLHQTVAETVLGVTSTSGVLSKQVAKQWGNRVRFYDRFDGGITPDTARYYGYALWLMYSALDRKNHVTQATTMQGKAVAYGLHLVEPRLALDYLPRLEQAGDLLGVDEVRVAYTTRKTASTDTAFADIALWLMLFDGRSRPTPQPELVAGVAAKFGKSPRFVRPQNRVRPNRFKV